MGAGRHSTPRHEGSPKLSVPSTVVECFVRDEGVAGSNPATPTSFLHNRSRHGERYGERNPPVTPQPEDGQRQLLRFPEENFRAHDCVSAHLSRKISRNGSLCHWACQRRPVLLPAMRLSEVPELRLAERAVSAQFLTRAMIIVPFPVSACDKSTAYIPV